MKNKDNNKINEHWCSCGSNEDTKYSISPFGIRIFFEKTENKNHLCLWCTLKITFTFIFHPIFFPIHFVLSWKVNISIYMFKNLKVFSPLLSVTINGMNMNMHTWNFYANRFLCGRKRLTLWHSFSM